MGVGIGGGIAISAGLGAATSLAGGLISSGAASDAANAQIAASQSAQATTLSMFNQTQKNLAPFISLGTTAANALGAGLGLSGYGPSGPVVAGGSVGNVPGTNAGGIAPGSLIAPFAPTQAQLEQTPGYQFTLGQGLESTQNSFAAQGLASSGAALKGAASFATGLASNTYQQQFQNFLATQQQQYNMLTGPMQTGAQAATAQGNIASSTAGSLSNLITGAGAASAAGAVGSANALNNALGGLSSAGSNYALLSALNNQGMFGGAAAGGVIDSGSFGV